MFFNLSYITRPILTLFIHFDLHHFFHNAEYIFFIPDDAVDQQFKALLEQNLLYNVYSFDTMEFSIKK